MRRLATVLLGSPVLVAGLFTGATAGCGAHDGGSSSSESASEFASEFASESSPDAALGTRATPAAQRLRQARALARPEPRFRDALGEDAPATEPTDATDATDARKPAARLRVTREAFTSEGFDEAARGSASAFGARVPAQADGALEVRHGEASVTLRIDGARPAHGEFVDGEAVFPDAHASTDLLIASTPARVEAFWLLRDAAAPTRFTLAMSLRGLTAQLDEQGVRFADAAGAVKLRMPRPAAIDSNGVRRDAALTLDGDRLTIALDTRDLAFPILLDPALEQVAWTDLGPDVPVWPPPGGIGHQRITYPGGLQREGGSARATGTGLVYLFGGSQVFFTGGSSGSVSMVNPLATGLFEFNGTGWVASAGGGFTDPLQQTDPAYGPIDRVCDIAWDPVRSKLVLFGGYTLGASVPHLGIYEYDPTAKVWAKACLDGSACYNTVPAVNTATSPSPPSAVWAFGKAVVVHQSGTYWWDPATKTLKPFGATPDLKRAGAGLAFDANRNRLIAYGDTTGLSDTWESDGTTWTKSPAVGPIGLRDPQLTYHAGRKRVVLWNASFSTGGLWEWDGATWTSVPVAGTGISLRPNAAVTYEPKSGKLVLMGGGDLGNFNASSCFGNVLATPYDNNSDLRGCARVDTWTGVLLGGACTTAADCTGGATCVDGVCCATPCAGSCQTCNSAAAPGTCTTVKSAEDVGTCATTSACDATGVCRKNQGQTCTLGTDCLTGNCVDGYCCDTACPGACDACNLAGTVGTCKPLTKGSTGTGCGNYTCTGTSATCATTCAADADCAPQAYCSATGACVPVAAKGTACARDRQCGSGVCVDGVCCDSACAGTCDVCATSLGASADGTCTILAKTATPAACGAARCSGTSSACGATCTVDGDCSASGYCNAGSCAPLRKKGESCDRATQCGGGLSCADSVCCNAACDGACQACSALNKESGAASGECGPAKDGTNPRALCAKSAVTSCGSSGFCNATGACAVYSAGTPCGPTGSTSCDGDTVKGQTCDGLGVCVLDAAGTPCSPSKCSGGACKSSCSTDADCAADGYCTAGTCKKRAAPGAKCGIDAQCGSGFCADGVCCNARCDGTCEACDQAGTGGTCTAVTGKPRLGHPACAAGEPGNPCSAAACDGVERASCAKKAGAEVACRKGSCEADVESLPTTCDGSGACPTAQTRPCQPFACGADACNKSCGADKDCKAGFVCDVATGACAAGDKCLGSVVTHVDGTTTDCAPYVCESSGRCKTTCAATTDCVSPKLCNDGTCIDPVEAQATQQGGCATSPGGARSGGALLFVVALASAFRRRRRHG
jgi:hypothetical protein